MDNASPNKSYAVIAAMGALGLLGVVRKVKISYLLAGHSHTFGDGIMGTVGSVINNENMQTFEVVRELIIATGKQQGYANVDVFQIIGITDYKSLFADIRSNPHDITGMCVLCVKYY
jgi:hypothetical protein